MSHRLKNLPQPESALEWEARSINVGQDAGILWLVCVTCSWHDLFLVRKLFESVPTAAELWDVLTQAIEFPESSEPQRPGKLMIEPKQGWEILKPKLKEIGIALVKAKDLDYPDGFPEWISETLQKWQQRRNGR